jgi:hypothetical protein
MPTFCLSILCVFSPSPPPWLWHQLTTGAFPFDGESPLELLKRIMYAPALPVEGVFSPELKKAIMSMLQNVFFCLYGIIFFLFTESGGEVNSERSAGTGGGTGVDPAAQPGHSRVRELDAARLCC